ncbi:MAG TPA: thiamine pyrophosphate-requiring protein [Rhodanobacteraceae bacterium]|nr:thiamine pyrophosphate-requiring protein [Rhodanobacteraceae bacterium]
MYTTSTAFLEALAELGVAYVFVNFGSDHAAIIESLAVARVEGRRLPEVVVCPHESVALSAAHGYAQSTGQPQAVIVHVDVGTQNLGGALHNASRGRVPVLIFAGTSPSTQEGELTGSRNEHILWLQNVFDQAGIVREYVKYGYEIRNGCNVKQLAYRAMQIATTDPKGPVYLTASREVLDESTTPVTLDRRRWRPVAVGALAAADVAGVVDDLLAARHPLIVTSYLGRNPRAVDGLVRLCERLAIPVVESVPNYMNFPATHPLYCGSQWNEQAQNERLAEADLVLVLDSDVPWMPMVNRPSPDATVYCLDVDPLKESFPLWYVPAKGAFRVDAATALAQLNGELDARAVDSTQIEARRHDVEAAHAAWLAALEHAEAADGESITAAYLTARIRQLIDDDAIVLNEGISNYGVIARHLQRSRSGSLLASGASSLGWYGGAAVGVKLGHPDQQVVALVGDGTYLFGVPASVYWVAQRYHTPFLTVIFDNCGWKSPKLSTLGVHPDGVARRTNVFGVEFDGTSRLADVAAAMGGTAAFEVASRATLDATLLDALQRVRGGQCAVVDVKLPRIADER